MEMRAGDPERLGDGLHREPSFGCDKSRKLGFFDSDFASASLQDLHLHGLAAEQPLEVADALLEPSHLRAPDNRLVRSHRRRSALRHQTAPTIQQIGRDAASSGNRGHRLAREKTLLDDLQLLFGRPMPAARRAGDQFDPSIIVRHKPVLEDSLKPSRLCRLSGRNGGQFRAEFSCPMPCTTTCKASCHFASTTWGSAPSRTSHGQSAFFGSAGTEDRQGTPPNRRPYLCHCRSKPSIADDHFPLASRGPSTHGSSRRPRARRHATAGQPPGPAYGRPEDRLRGRRCP